jgi:hypothetical protein
VKIEVSGIVSKWGLGDGNWFDREHYAALGVRIGEALWERNPRGTFTIVQVDTLHNPIRLYEAFRDHQEAKLDLSGTVSLRGLKPLPWSRPVGSWVWADWTEENGSWGGYVTEFDYSQVEGVIFEAVAGVVTFRRDLHGLKRPKLHGDCPYCGQVGGVSQYDTLCGEHGPAVGFVSKDGLKFTPAQ